MATHNPLSEDGESSCQSPASPLPATEGKSSSPHSSPTPILDTTIASPTLLRPPSSRSTVAELKAALDALNLDTKGKRETLVRRLNAGIRRSVSPAPAPPPGSSTGFTSAAPTAGSGGPNGILTKSRSGRKMQRQGQRQPIRRFLVLDVEATCTSDKTMEWPNEIIEWPVVLLGFSDDVPNSDREQHPSTPLSSSAPSSSAVTPVPTLRVLDTFQSYVRPTWSPNLSTFAKSLTGISQETVDGAPTFPEVIEKFEAWLDRHGLLDDDKRGLRGDCCWCTDGPWDLRDFVPKQLFITPLLPSAAFKSPYPKYFTGPYLNVKQAVHTVLSAEWHRLHDFPQSSTNSTPHPRLSTAHVPRHSSSRKSLSRSPGFYRTIQGQLEALNLGQFQGQQHSGIDDARNIARVVQELARRDVLLEPNGELSPSIFGRKWDWMGSKAGEVVWTRHKPGKCEAVDVSEIAARLDGEDEGEEGGKGKIVDDVQ